MLFTDGSVNTHTKHGFGASLFITSDEITHTLDELKQRIKFYEFTETSSTKVELQTVLGALADIPVSCRPLTVYTDSQNTLSLLARRERLEAHGFYSKNGRLLKNTVLYRAFFQLVDQRDLKLVKVKGHQSTQSRKAIDCLFNLVDKASRKASRKQKLMNF